MEGWHASEAQLGYGGEVAEVYRAGIEGSCLKGSGQARQEAEICIDVKSAT